MIIGSPMQKMMSEQITAEFASAYLYLSMAAYLEEHSLSGMAHWMKKQAEEEISHGMKLYNHVIERGGKVHLQEITKPKQSWHNIQEVFADVLKHEQQVSELILDLYRLAQKEKDHASEIFLQWFVNEQVEEEATASEILAKVSSVAHTKQGLFMYDAHLGKR